MINKQVTWIGLPRVMVANVALAAHRGLIVVEVPTGFLRGVSTRSSVRIVRDVIHYGLNLFRFRCRMGPKLRATNPRKKL